MTNCEGNDRMGPESTMLKQAVILCGGLGTRLLPLTKDIPKPMVEVGRVPFLVHLIDQLKQQGVKKILLLTGYKKEKISEYFGNGEKFGIQIEYSEGPVEWETAKRLRGALDLLDEYFFLMYGDNYYNFNIKELNLLATKKQSKITLLVSLKNPGNISVDADNNVLCYDSLRSHEHEFVEIGFMVVNKSVVQSIDPQENHSFSKTLNHYASLGNISAIQAHDAYYSVSDIDRLEILREFLRPKKIILIDRDGTLHEKRKDAFYVTSPDQLIYIEDSIAGLKLLSENGYRFLVITNQAGISTGDLTEAQLDLIHQKIKTDLTQHGIEILEFYYSSAHWKDLNNFFRKPNPGMFFLASKEYKLALNQTYYIGDDQRDMVASKNANTKGIFYGNVEDIKDLETRTICAFTSTNMIEVAKFILRKSQESA